MLVVHVLNLSYIFCNNSYATPYCLYTCNCYNIIVRPRDCCLVTKVVLFVLLAVYFNATTHCQKIMAEGTTKTEGFYEGNQPSNKLKLRIFWANAIANRLHLLQ